MDQRPDAAPGLPDELSRFAFEGAPVGLACVNGSDGRIAAANPALAALLGVAPENLIGRVLGEGGGDPADGETRETVWHRADGSTVRLRLRSGPERQAFRIVSVDALAEAPAFRLDPLREQAHLALASAGLGEWSWSPADGRVVLSDRAAAILGLPAGATPTWAVLREAIARDDLDRLRATVEDAVAKASPYAVELRYRRASDGQEAWISARGRAIPGPDGALAGMVGIVQDVTAREEARRALHDREQRLRVATTVAALGIFEWHVLADQSLWENERMWEIFGRRPQDGTISMREFFRTVVHPEDKAAFRQAVTAALHSDGVLHATTRIRRRGSAEADTVWRTIEMAGRFERDGPAGLPSRLIGVVADITDRRLAEERQSLLIRELHHRVKNTLATVQAIVGSTARTASSIDSFYEAFVGRIMSLAHTHSVLTEDVWQTASLRNLLENELRPYADGAMQPGTGGRVELDGPAVDLPSEIAVPIGMAIHELTTNAAKYGALSNRAGRVRIRWSVEPGTDRPRLRFRWQESGGPAVAPPTRQGFGSRLLQRVLTTQVQAEVATDYAPGGFALTMLAPLPARNAALNPLAAL
ncbi:sensor histidine kinase [Methylobacterium indicum]|uniref:Blue-light-activated histidine kinase n=1 Tax=Methylobacterium indicum TaxID=1775910 RepID=A0A8H8X017_9HYPH|nr:HWE histidine kinase domain-containing protein [Methylobacterium indicum]BCM87367.1 hypothetical protein mvi_58280 [Methylobacterium indicum]